jgi:carbon storage regulator
MLALTRKKGESIIIDDNIEIVLLGIQGDQVKIGIIAPKSVLIYRKEIYEQIRQENKEASAHINLAALRSLKKEQGGEGGNIMSWVVDRIENNVAVLENLADGSSMETTAAALPSGTGEGSVLRRENDTWVLDAEATAARSRQIRSRFNKLKKK